MSSFLDDIMESSPALAENTDLLSGEGASPVTAEEPEGSLAQDSAGLPELETGLDRDGKGKLVANLNNAVMLIENDPLYRDRLWFDEFLQRPMTGNPAREWTDADDLNLTLYIQRTRSVPRIGRDVVSQAALTVAFRHRRNCVKDWMESLSLCWDQVPRIEHFFEDHFGAEGTIYTRAASRNFWISMPARIYRPGCQADNMIVLEGPQGIGKSSALRVIGGPWFAEQHENVTGRGFFEVLQGKVLVEVSEMDAFSRADITRVKQVVTCVSDRYREPYGRHAKDHPRQCVFVGTTNKDDWNRDETGARRFWPIACRGDIDIEGIAGSRVQLFAEAVARFKHGESWWHMPAQETQQQQVNRYVAPAWAEPIRRYLEQQHASEVSIAEVLEHALAVPKSQWTKGVEMRVAESLRFLGLEKRDVRRDGRVVKRWLRPDVATDHEEAT
jgi:predicted P-loop ATPase